MSPNRVKMAPSGVEIRLNTADLALIAEEMEIAAAAEFASAAYRSAITKHGALVSSSAPLEVRISEDASVPAGRYRIVALPESDLRYSATALAANPALRLVTGNEVAESRISGVRAGRSKTVEFVLPVKRTVSRIHARFTVIDGDWHITGLGVNGILVNDCPLTGVQMLYDGDVLSWGRTADAPTSRVEILP
ncbi:MAG TPA: FHA domain-containing protein [Streptosporangiaceae bacterium]|nr:FHA domain-containing protein [Streptosporangiaceae bacterium]